jgi:hypothetical protein
VDARQKMAVAFNTSNRRELDLESLSSTPKITSEVAAWQHHSHEAFVGNHLTHFSCAKRIAFAGPAIVTSVLETRYGLPAIIPLLKE